MVYVCIGYNSGENNQNAHSIALGYQSGQDYQNTYSIAMGYQAGQSKQDYNSVAIGKEAGRFSQNAHSVAIGNSAGKSYQHENTIIINATGSELNSSNVSNTYIKPIHSLGLDSGVGGAPSTNVFLHTNGFIYGQLYCNVQTGQICVVGQ